MSSLTDREIVGAIRKAKASGADVWLTDASKARGIGRLRVRARPTGQCLFYFRYATSAGKQDAIALGVYDITGRAGLTLKAAREKAGECSLLYRGGQRDLRSYIEHQNAEGRARIEAAARARAEEERQARSGTLKALLNGYVAHLDRQGKHGSARDARNSFQANVFKRWPHLAEMKASLITNEDVSKILAALIDRGKGRTAGKLRAYLRAAYAAALQAPSDPTIHADLHGFNLTANPVAAVPAKPLARFNVAGERTLNTSELKAFLVALGAVEYLGVPAEDAADPKRDKFRVRPGLSRDVLWLCLFLGGQRAAQLARARPEDVDADDQTITLYDPKGARKQPRTHRLPLTNRAAEIIERLLERTGEDGEPLPYIFTNNGRVPVRVETLSGAVNDICAHMLKKKTARGPFQFRDIRRTCETMLAGLGISKDVRAQILSHGLGGVQDRHYDRHEYMDEKRRALEAWNARLVEIASGAAVQNVVPLKRA